jgi:DNA-binding CsgD family transcriptional regulator
MDKADKLDYERGLATVRAHLDEAAFATAYSEGQMMTLDQSVTYALGAAATLVEMQPVEWRNNSETVQYSSQSLTTPLSKREVEILRLVAEGHTNQEIAERLFIGVSTVKKHINHIYDKLDVKNRTQAVALAHERHILTRYPSSHPLNSPFT